MLPWLHYSNNILIWRSWSYSDDLIVTVNLILLLANSIFLFIYKINFRSYFGQLKNTKLKNIKTSKITLLIFSLASFIFVLYLNNFSLSNILLRGLVDGQKDVVISDGSLLLIFTMASRLIPVFCFFWALANFKKINNTSILLFLILIFSVFPTGVPRYMVGFVYIPILLVLFPKMRNSFVFIILMLSAVFYVFPFLDQFRYFKGVENISYLPAPGFFNAGHFDAYENLATVFEEGFVTYGYQLLGFIFFFVPRSFWLGKPVGSGYEMANNLGYSFNNISMPFLGEGYVNFGIFGMFLFAAIAGYSMAKLDSYFARLQAKDELSYDLFIYYFLVGSLFFLLRGDLLSSGSYIISGVFVFYLVAGLMKVVNSFGFK